MRYRLYVTDWTNHILAAHDLYYEDDAAAVSGAESFERGRHTAELWQGERYVRRFERSAVQSQPLRRNHNSGAAEDMSIRRIASR